MVPIKNPIQYIKSDLYRYTGQTTIKAFLKQYLTHRGFNFSVWLRLVSVNKWYSKIAYPLYWHKKRRYGIDIIYTTQIGYGLYLGHSGPVVVNATAILGNNVNLSQFSTIGANEGKAAVIGNNVYIGPQTCLIGHIKIGDDVTIGAGAIVTKDIAEKATAVGNPAKIIHYNEPAKYIKNKWIVDE